MKEKSTIIKGNTIKRQWHVVDITDKILGRVAVQIANLLMGKNKVDYSPERDGGDYVIVTNAAKVLVTGNKVKEKMYYSYTGYPGGLKELTFETLMKKDPRRIITRAVAGMIPKNKLRADRIARLKVFVDGEHPYHDKITQ